MMGILGGDDQCPIARALDVLGEKWTLLVVRDALAGSTRFSEFQSSLGLPRDVLSARLDTLVTAGVMERHPYKTADTRTRDEYVLTAAGRELSLVLLALGNWANHNRPSAHEPTLEFVDTVSKKPLRPAAVVGERLVRMTQIEVRRRAGKAAQPRM